MSVSDITGYTASGDQIYSVRSFYTDLVVQKGRPMVLSGIKKQSQVEAKTGMPFLVDIPYVGQYLFGKTTNTDNTKELVVFLDPEFEVFSMDNASAPKSVKTAQALLRGEDALEVPNNSYGYDQWLIGK